MLLAKAQVSWCTSTSVPHLASTCHCALLRSPTAKPRCAPAIRPPLGTSTTTTHAGQAIVLVIWVSAMLGVLGTLALILQQYFATANVYFLEHTNLVIANLVICAVLMLTMTVVSIAFTWQLIRVARRLPKGVRYNMGSLSYIHLHHPVPYM